MCIRDRRNEIDAFIEKAKEKYPNNKAVSYTHLDVYKRQD